MDWTRNRTNDPGQVLAAAASDPGRRLRSARDCGRTPEETVSHLSGRVGFSDKIFRTVIENAHKLEVDGHGFD